MRLNFASVARPAIVAVAIAIATVAVAQDRQFKFAPPDEKLVYRTLPSGKELSIWVYRPKDKSAANEAGLLPAIVLYHGGGWRTGTPAQFVAIASHFVDAGMVALLPEYRVYERDQSSIPDSTADGRSAMRYIMAHEAELGLDPARIVAGGGSAGGHIAATLATTDDVNNEGDDLSIDPRPAAYIGFSAAVNLKGIFTTEGAGRGAGATLGPNGLEGALVADPMTHLKPGFPPCLFFHGTQDSVVPYKSVVDFVAAAKAVGTECELVAYEGRPHSFFNPLSSKADFPDMMRRADEFLRAHGMLPKP
ncbi:MAG: alpha/beta hydrolase [Alphaproteobacteria bacterium]|nr:alpha/beta hydrolase [Alphaproteobacteria bacterium]